MALTSKSSALDDILFVVVTCTRDHSREHALKKLVKSIQTQHAQVGFNGNLLIFDNASHTLEPLKPLEGIARFVLSESNVGYWSALNWSMENASHILGRTFPYIHPIESDLVLFKMERLARARDFLEKHPDIESVRTQEFSVRNRHRYFKNGRTLFSVRRSQVADYNGVTEEKVDFEAVDECTDIFLANWHSKVPALHRFEALQSVFSDLAAQEKLSELDFMRLMHKRCPRVGVLDGGIFFCLLNNPIWFWEKRWMTGSWGDPKVMRELGYRSSRHDRIDDSTNDTVVVERIP